MLCSASLRQIVSFTVAPGAMAPICLTRSRASLTASPFTAVMTSPERMPALAAGLSFSGSATSAPLLSFMPRLSAMWVVTGWICTPIQPPPVAVSAALAVAPREGRLAGPARGDQQGGGSEAGADRGKDEAPRASASPFVLAFIIVVVSMSVYGAGGAAWRLNEGGSITAR